MTGGYNRLVTEKSPYLLQHAANPVDWYPWGDEAFAAARSADKPIFLSIGYATCHWCHVMERESFEDPDVARLMNESFVSIKVDREERPDIDGVYMTVCQLMTGHGGWPLTIAMTSDRRPFFAGTYFPKQGRHGRIGMLELIPRLRELWDTRREEIDATTEAVLEAARRPSRPGGSNAMEEDVLARGFEALSSVFDAHQGGFGAAPKFPTPHNLLFLLRYWRRSGEPRALEMVDRTLTAMRRGGIYDQVGFGFHRYSTDARWQVPHFEKMLYDQAMLAIAYTEAALATGAEDHGRTAREILTYVLRDLADPIGGFYSAEDADSEGREGKFYLWTAGELDALLGDDDSALARRIYNVERRGNFSEEATGQRTGENVLHLLAPLTDLAEAEGLDPETLSERLDSIRERLFEERRARIRPLLDDKILTDWNGLMIAAFAMAARAFDRPEYLEAASRAAAFLLDNLRDREGRLLHRYREGDAAFDATAADYAFLAWGLIELYEAGYEPAHLEAALALTDRLVEEFWDPEDGGLFVVSRDSEELPVRQKEVYDGAVPSANAVAYLNFLRLARLTGRRDLEEYAARQESTFGGVVAAAAPAHTFWLAALDFRVGPSHELVIVGRPGAADTERLMAATGGRFLPNLVTLLKPVGETVDGEAEVPTIERLAPFTGALTTVGGKAAAYLCTDFACRRPTTKAEELSDALA